MTKGLECNGCVACCLGEDYVKLSPEDSPALWAKHPDGRIARSGRCPYLGGGGCLIYSIRPKTCRDFDCRIAYKKWSSLEPLRRVEIVNKVPHAVGILNAGKERTK